jgi:hypothetical protein
MNKSPRDFDDPWCLYLYLMLDCYCEGCCERPEIAALWETIPPGPSECQAEEWVQRAADLLERKGWQIIEEMPYCRGCAADRAGQ